MVVPDILRIFPKKNCLISKSLLIVKSFVFVEIIPDSNTGDDSGSICWDNAVWGMSKINEKKLRVRYCLSEANSVL